MVSKNETEDERQASLNEQAGQAIYQFAIVELKKRGLDPLHLSLVMNLAYSDSVTASAAFIESMQVKGSVEGFIKMQRKLCEMTFEAVLEDI